VFTRSQTMLNDWKSARVISHRARAEQPNVSTIDGNKPGAGPLCEVHFGEVLGLLSALNSVQELCLVQVDFELDSKMFDSFQSSMHDVEEF